MGGIVETTGVGYQLVGLPGFSAREGEAKGFTSGGGFAARETHPHTHTLPLPTHGIETPASICGIARKKNEVTLGQSSGCGKLRHRQ